MIDTTQCSAKGFVTIRDKDTKEVLLDVHNDVLHSNLSVILARALNGSSSNFITYMAFGNGGAYIDNTGSIAYRPSRGGANNMQFTQTEMLYNCIYVKKVENASSNVTAPSSKSVTVDGSNYGDIVLSVTMDYSEPNFTIGASLIQQGAIDNSVFAGQVDPLAPSRDYSSGSSNTFVFNEIGLFAGPSGIFGNNDTQTTGDVDTFVSSTARTMLTHVIFHPIQKAANRSLEIVYTLRIQMSATVV